MATKWNPTKQVMRWRNKGSAVINEMDYPPAAEREAVEWAIDPETNTPDFMRPTKFHVWMTLGDGTHWPFLESTDWHEFVTVPV